MGPRDLQVVGPEGSTKLAYGFVSGVYGCAGTGNTDVIGDVRFDSRQNRISRHGHKLR